MVKTKRFHVLVAGGLSGVAALVTIVALASDAWVVADGESGGSINHHFEYGLFKGFYHSSLAQDAEFNVQMTCLWGSNVCALLCQVDDQSPSDILQALYDGKGASMSLDHCNIVRSLRTRHLLKDDDVIPEQIDLKFISAGALVCTILFAVLSALFGVISAGLAFWNTTSNPIEVYFSIAALYYYNAIAWCCCVLYLMIWGIFFAVTLTDNAAVQVSLTIVQTSDLTSLGYSYWINFAPLLLYVASPAILYLRQYLIDKEPNLTVPIEDSADPSILIF